MTTLTLPTVAASSRVKFSSLIHVELRKLVNTRASRVLLIVFLSLTLLVAGAVSSLIAWLSTKAEGKDLMLSWHTTMSSADWMLGILLPILAALSVTSEWTQRTVLSTFVQEPRRMRWLTAKATVVCLASLVATSLAALVGAAGLLFARGIFHTSIVWNEPGKAFPLLLGGMFFGLLWKTMFGFACGLLILNGAGAIVTIVLTPMVLDLVGTGLLLTSFRRFIPWVNPSTSRDALASGTFNATTLAQFALTTIVWIGIPLAIGILRWKDKQAS